ncbi:hypothetical protein [Flavihumibacter petaseus]|uniref:Porin n=1 Tax=Flavihumibacter petaseus NBRC 106054 TaxID=1220578 RepID=A0A0E9N6L5_9BACT|nr:hypothetical protein [Flavihumibacter petaseus]GAO45433.1 hypothetical protein FPE01S_05_01280 [Flavihumibacter petaseus NBRC 106054]
MIASYRIAMVVLITMAGSLPLRAQFGSTPPEDSTREKNSDHRPGTGFLLVSKKGGTLIFSPFATIRYLNSKGIKDSYTDVGGQTHDVAQRDDIQFQKVTLYFKGWLFTPKFRYFTYVWTSNANQGQGAQVVVAGNLQYEINKHFDVGAGIGALPTSRSLYGQWPLWLRQDARPMAEEYFRGSFTTGVWLQGEIVNGLYYKTMLGNNLSQLGVDAGQLDDGFNTWSTALWHTTGDFGRLGPFGDFEKHASLATIVGGSFTRSNETRQSQPGTDAPENSQIRLSDGTGIFGLNALAPNSQVQEAKYEMASFNGGIKYKGFSFDAEYFIRWVSKFTTTGVIPVSRLKDNGFSMQASAIVVNKLLQVYAVGSYINGQYGYPSELNFGLNFHPFKNRVFRINPEVIFSNHSPVGYYSYPTVVGAKGTIYMINLELFY